MKRLSQISVMLLFCGLCAIAQPPKREMRSSWLTTVWMLDWPSTTVPALGTEGARETARTIQKNGLISILNSLQEANVNAVFFQIRSMCDAMYPSSYEPWSSFVSSERGADPGYDPLAFAIEEAHKRGMELHAWINPYRYSSSSATHGNLSTDYPTTHPDWLMNYDTYTKILNPGMPEVMQRITDIVAEVITNYDVDGIVFDDYFYINGSTTDALDQVQYDAYNPDGLSRADWRRENCNKMIMKVYNKIQELKPYVTFGVSPAGVAASSALVAAKYGVSPSPVGNDWQYNGIYSDPLAWLAQGAIDYISPQIYWTTNSSNSYAQLAPWWSTVANKFGKHFYSSHSLTDMASAAPQVAKSTIIIKDDTVSLNTLSEIELSSAVTKTTSTMQKVTSGFSFAELGLQIDWNRNSDLNGAPGSVFYATSKATGSNFVNYLNTNKFSKPSLVPAISWKNAETQTLVENLSLSGQTLSWTYPKNDVRYAVYAVPNANRNDVSVFSTSLYLLDVSYKKQYTLPNNISNTNYKIAVSVLDRYGNEFSPRVLGESVVATTAAELTYPADGATVIIPATFQWNAVPDADLYVWEVATNPDFTNMLCARETTEPRFFSGLEPQIKGNNTYYWRVRTRKANMIDSYSHIFTTNGNAFQITTPISGSTSVSVSPTFIWMNMGSGASYTLEISTSALFSTSDIVYSQTTTQTTLSVPSNTLLSETIYYARVKMTNGTVNAVTEVCNFTTELLEIGVPVIFNPVDGSTINGTEIEVSWEPQNSKGFIAELSKNPSFPSRSTIYKTVGAFVYSAVYSNCDEGTYYMRVKAKTSSGTTDASNVVTVYLSGVSAVNNIVNTSGIYIHRDNEGLLYLIMECNEQLRGTVGIYSTAGLLVENFSYDINEGKNKLFLNLNQYPKGVYIVKISFGAQYKTLKVLR